MSHATTHTVLRGLTVVYGPISFLFETVGHIKFKRVVGVREIRWTLPRPVA
ncbi:MAG: hypothetical protein O3A00_08855 [Planctomycetota bacterium]|nr:hypothetical protein [Planctomycetota bacterium]